MDQDIGDNTTFEIISDMEMCFETYSESTRSTTGIIIPSNYSYMYVAIHLAMCNNYLHIASYYVAV